MTTWNSRIILRNDSDWGIDEVAGIEYTLAKGEVGAQITGNRLVVRVGVNPTGTPFSECVLLYDGAIVGANTPLSVEVPEGSGLEDGTMLRWDPSTSRFVLDAEPIAFAASVSGAIKYNAATDTWSSDAGHFIPESIDGGTFVIDGPETVAPSFTSVPTIGEPTTP